jgi:hypothetical protein
MLSCAESAAVNLHGVAPAALCHACQPFHLPAPLRLRCIRLPALVVSAAPAAPMPRLRRLVCGGNDSCSRHLAISQYGEKIEGLIEEAL